LRPYFGKKSPSPKRAGGVAQDVGPEFKPQYCKKKKKISLNWNILTLKHKQNWLTQLCVNKKTQSVQNSN
jgi:hypothetical protein